MMTLWRSVCGRWSYGHYRLSNVLMHDSSLLFIWYVIDLLPPNIDTTSKKNHSHRKYPIVAPALKRERPGNVFNWSGLCQGMSIDNLFARVAIRKSRSEPGVTWPLMDEKIAVQLRPLFIYPPTYRSWVLPSLQILSPVRSTLLQNVHVSAKSIMERQHQSVSGVCRAIFMFPKVTTICLSFWSIDTF